MKTSVWRYRKRPKENEPCRFRSSFDCDPNVSRPVRIMTPPEPLSEEASSAPFEEKNDRPGSFDDAGSASAMEMSSLAWTVGRNWIEDHQESAMLGAFAVGVFVGALVRDSRSEGL